MGFQPRKKWWVPCRRIGVAKGILDGKFSAKISDYPKGGN
jgi:hypothetical protein